MNKEGAGSLALSCAAYAVCSVCVQCVYLGVCVCVCVRVCLALCQAKQTARGLCRCLEFCFIWLGICLPLAHSTSALPCSTLRCAPPHAWILLQPPIQHTLSEPESRLFRAEEFIITYSDYTWVVWSSIRTRYQLWFPLSSSVRCVSRTAVFWALSPSQHAQNDNAVIRSLRTNVYWLSLVC